MNIKFLAAAALAAMAALYIAQGYCGNPLIRVLLKTCCTLVCFALFVLRAADAGFGLKDALFAVALAVCAAADFAIGYSFNAGVAIFGIAHVFYSAAFVLSGARPPLSAACFAASAATMACLAGRWKLRLSEHRNYQVYMVLLSAMFSLSAGRNIGAFAGAAAFVASDLLLIYNKTVLKSGAFGRFSLGVYYIAQFLLALSF